MTSTILSVRNKRWHQKNNKSEGFFSISFSFFKTLFPLSVFNPIEVMLINDYFIQPLVKTRLPNQNWETKFPNKVS